VYLSQKAASIDAVDDDSPRSQQLRMKALFYKSAMTFRGVSADFAEEWTRQ
jgi:hypothetical protein